MAELLSDAFLDAVLRIQSHFSGKWRSKKFIKAYTVMLGYFATDPLDTWIPKLFENSDEADRRHFAFEIRNHLLCITGEQRHEWWKRWLCSYWKDRLTSSPVPLASGEVEPMLNWLPRLKEVFPDAVDLAIRMPQTPLKYGRVIHEISESKLYRTHPEAVAKLLIHWGGFEAPPYAWHGGRKLIDKLLKSNLPCDLGQGLRELIAKLGLT